MHSIVGVCVKHVPTNIPWHECARRFLFHVPQVALEMQKKTLSEQREQVMDTHISNTSTTLIIKLQQEVKSIKESKRQLEEELRLKTISEAEKSAEINHIQREYEAKLKSIMKEHRLQLQKLETANIMNEESARNTREEQSNYEADNSADDTGLPEKYILPTIENKSSSVISNNINENQEQLEKEDTFNQGYDHEKGIVRGKCSPQQSSRGSRESISSCELEVSVSQYLLCLCHM